MPHASAARALVTRGGLAPRQVVLLTPASPTAIPIAAIAAAAQDDLHAASDAYEQTGWTIQRRHQTEPVVLDGIVPARHTDAAPPSSARCRARRGRQAARRERPPPCPPSSARIGLYCTGSSQAGQLRIAACCASPAMPITEVMAIGLETSDDDVVEAGLVALQGDQATSPSSISCSARIASGRRRMGTQNQIRVLAVK